MLLSLPFQDLTFYAVGQIIHMAPGKRKFCLASQIRDARLFFFPFIEQTA